MATDEVKIKKIEELEGQDRMALAEAAIMDSVCIGICMNDDCDYTTEYEQDCTEGWCEECDTGTVKSLMILMGVI